MTRAMRVLGAFAARSRECAVFVAHDLDADNVALLRAGKLSAVLHHDLGQDMRRACHVIMQAHRALPGGIHSWPASVQVVTPFNAPLNLVAHKAGPALAAGNCVIVKPAPQEPAPALPDDATVVTGCEDGSIRLWDARTGQPIGSAPLPRDDSVSALTMADGRVLVGTTRGVLLVPVTEHLRRPAEQDPRPTLAEPGDEREGRIEEERRIV